MTLPALAAALIALAPRLASAEDAAVAPAPAAREKLIRVAAAVQFVRGNASHEALSGARAPLAYQSVVYEGERVLVESGGALKLALRSGCLLVLYGQARAVAPEGERPWRVRAPGGAARAICPAGAELKFEQGGISWAVGPASEALVSPKRAVVLAGAASADGDALKTRALYAVDKGVRAAGSAREAYELNNSYSPPAESAPWTMDAPAAKAAPKTAPEPSEPARNRVMLSPYMSRGFVVAENPERSQSGLEGDGGRLQYQRQLGERALIFALSFENFSDPARNHGNSNSGPGPGGNGTPLGTSHSIEALTLEAGLRLWHLNWWSPYARAGAQRLTDKISVYRPDFNYNSYHEYSRWAATLAVGVDARWSPSWLDWLGVFGGLEARAAQSVVDVGDSAQSGSTGGSSPPNEVGAHGWQATVAASAFAGLFVQF